MKCCGGKYADRHIAFFDHPGLLEGLRMLPGRGLPYDACVVHEQLPALTELLSAIESLDGSPRTAMPRRAKLAVKRWR